MEEKKKLQGKYEVYQDNNFYRYVLKASNGEKLIESELYKSKESCIQAIETLKKNIVEGEISVSKDKRDTYQFKLTGKNKRVLALSTTYKTEKGALSAVESFKRFGIDANIHEVTDIESNLELFVLPNEFEEKVGGKVVILEVNGLYVYQLYANNGELLCESEQYKNKITAKEAFENLKEHLKTGSFYYVKNKTGRYQFKLYSKNNRLILIGESFLNKQQVINNANSIRSFIYKAV